MNRLVTIGIVTAFALTGTACMTPAAMQRTSTAPVGDTAAEQPWVKAQNVVRATGNDLSRGGLQAVRPHVAELEQALSDGKPLFGMNASNPGIVFSDGPTESLGLLLIAGSMGRQVSAIANPYPAASFFLGSYYNEVGRFADALRVLDQGLVLTAMPGSDLGETAPLILGERGAALNALKRYQASLDNFDRALKIKALKDDQRALMQRGRGFALTELGRLDEAEQAYRDSLKSEPNNPRAQNELTYIQRLRAGGPMAPSQLFTRMPQM